MNQKWQINLFKLSQLLKHIINYINKVKNSFSLYYTTQKKHKKVVDCGNLQTYQPVILLDNLPLYLQRGYLSSLLNYTLFCKLHFYIDKLCDGFIYCFIIKGTKIPILLLFVFLYLLNLFILSFIDLFFFLNGLTQLSSLKQ